MWLFLGISAMIFTGFNLIYSFKNKNESGLDSEPFLSLIAGHIIACAICLRRFWLIAEHTLPLHF